MKRLLALLLALVMVFALTACGGSDDSSDTTDTTDTADTAEVADAAEVADTAASTGDDLADYKAYVIAYATAGAPDEDSAAEVAEAVNACTTTDEVEAVSELTVLYENVGMLTYADWVAAGKPAADTDGIESEAVTQGEEPDSEGSGEAGYTSTVEVSNEGADDADYKAYLIAFVESCEDIQTSGSADEFIALIEAGDFSSFPAAMLFDATWFGEAAMTYAEFQAAGGVYTIGDHSSNGAMLDSTGE